ncbi:MAG TPA: hypothetical protein VFZ25_00800, partial [Chloroflexota bacterium]|nr:hypothetical protein [Chloroflexota bacterium]
FSGGKGLRGPQTAGLVLARPEIIRACAANGSPNHSIGRPMKVGKEELVGMAKAVEIYLNQDHDAVYEEWHRQLGVIESAVAEIPGVTITRSEAMYSEGIPATRIGIDAAVAGTSAAALGKALADGNPSIRVGTRPDSLLVVAQFIEKGEEATIADRLRQLLRVPVGAR